MQFNITLKLDSDRDVAGKPGELDKICEMKLNHRFSGISTSQKVLMGQMRQMIKYFTLKTSADLTTNIPKDDIFFFHPYNFTWIKNDTLFSSD